MSIQNLEHRTFGDVEFVRANDVWRMCATSTSYQMWFGYKLFKYAGETGPMHKTYERREGPGRPGATIWITRDFAAKIVNDAEAATTRPSL